MSGFCIMLINFSLTKLQVKETGFAIKSQRKRIYCYLNCVFYVHLKIKK